MFGIIAPLEERRREPTLTGAPRLVSTDRLRLDPPERLAPVADRQRMRWLGPIGSLALHLLPLLLLIEWPMAAPPEVEPIPVQLVLEPPPPPQPPPPPPTPVPPKPEFKPPPPGHIASEDIGDTKAKEASREPSNAPAVKDAPPPPPPEKTEAAPETPQQTAAVAPPPPPEKTEAPPSEPPQQTAAIVPPPPEKPPPPKPQQKSNPATQQSIRRTEEPAHTEARHAKYPGPAASRDEYLAYVHSLIRQHYNLLPLSMIGGRRGEAQIEFVVLDDGTIEMIRVRQSSGWQDIDARVELMIAAVRRVPPLPQWFQGPSMALILNLPFPDALRE